MFYNMKLKLFILSAAMFFVASAASGQDMFRVNVQEPEHAKMTVY